METSIINWMVIVISFLGYLMIGFVYKNLRVQNLQTALLVTNGLELLNLKHLLGILLFGIFGYLLFPDQRYLIQSIEIPPLRVLIPILVVIFVSAKISRRSAIAYEDENNSVSRYLFSHGWQYLSIRVPFLLCYEFFFRGIIFYQTLEVLPLIGAIAITTLFYFISHINDSKKELFATLPFGIVLCLITYLTHSIWYAFIIHLTVSAVYEISIFYYQTQKTIKS